MKFNGTTLPLNLIMEYTSTPNQRQENGAELDQNGNLYRDTMPHTRTSIKFTTQILTLDQKIQFQNILGYQGDLQRKVQVTFWNDETNNYSTQYFYLPDISFTVRDASATDLLYDPITVELIEY